MIIIVLGTLFGFTLIHSSHGKYAQLFARLSSSEEKEVRKYLDSIAVPYKEKNKTIWVMRNQVEALQEELNALGIPQHETGKGFELFDSNTWIKGEKELQVLEMRALKGQLERDLVGFENIKSARVILDLAPARKFGGQQYKTKASVILTLMPKARLTASQLRAITCHLAGAVRGLEPNMVAISDTTGRLYQAIDQEKESEKIIIEESLKDQVCTFLDKVLGEEHFHCFVKEQKIDIFIDKSIWEVGLEGEIQRCIKSITNIKPNIQLASFKKNWKEQKSRFGFMSLLFFVSMVVAALLSIYPFFRKRNKEDKLLKMATKVDMRKLASSLKGEDPEIVAWTLSYLEPKKAEEMIASFPEDFQDEVLYHLSEMEKENL